jgi:hypothetical protein
VQAASASRTLAIAPVAAHLCSPYNRRNPMKYLLPIAAAVAIGASPAAAAAQTLSLQLQDGRTTLVAERVSLPQILAEWQRVGGVTIVNGDRTSASPVNLYLVDMPEQDALAVLLRSVSGYILVPRAQRGSAASSIDRILILPASAVPPRDSAAPAAATQPVPPIAPRRVPFRRDPRAVADPRVAADERADERADDGAIASGVRAGDEPPQPHVVPATAATGVAATDTAGAAGAPPQLPVNPFAVAAGSSRPGTITPPPPPPETPRPPRRRGPTTPTPPQEVLILDPTRR